MRSKNGKWRPAWLVVFALLAVGSVTVLVANFQKQEALIIRSPASLERQQQSWDKTVAESTRPSGVETVQSVVDDSPTQTGSVIEASNTIVAGPRPPATLTPNLVVDGEWTSSNGGRPIWITIPAQGISTVIEPVGLNEDGSMAAPVDWSAVGWFEKGYLPGQAGSAVIAGHLDAPGGKQAVFWDLHLLRPEDEIRIEMNDGQIHLYKVERSATYLYNSAPLDEIFGWSAEPRLALITCQGGWSQGERTYADRLVVFARYSGEIDSEPDATVGRGAYR